MTLGSACPEPALLSSDTTFVARRYIYWMSRTWSVPCANPIEKRTPVGPAAPDEVGSLSADPTDSVQVRAITWTEPRHRPG